MDSFESIGLPLKSPRRASRPAASWPLAIRPEPREARRSAAREAARDPAFPTTRGRTKQGQEAVQSTAAADVI